MIKQLTDATIKGYTAKGLALVMLGTSWCNKCNLGQKNMEALEARFPWLKIAKIDIQLNQETLIRYSPNGLPYFVLFKDGAEKARVKGADLTVLEGFLKGVQNENN